MQKVVGSSPISRSLESPRLCGGFSTLEALVQGTSFSNRVQFAVFCVLRRIGSQKVGRVTQA